MSPLPQTYGNCYLDHTIQYVHRIIRLYSCCRPLLRPHLLQLAGAVSELRSVRLEHTLSLVGLLDEILVALLVGKVDRVFLGVEVQAGALHVVCAGLPAHERVLPPVALGQHIPVDAPLVTVPVAGLGGGLCGAVDAELLSVLATRDRANGLSHVPNSPGLEVGRCAGQDSGGSVETRLGAVHNPLGDRREGTAGCVSVWPSQSVLLPGFSYEVL
jgi:hypothetical protein